MVEEKWACIGDFAALFQYFWHRDFPMDAKGAIGARRADWTIHIGVVVRNIADLMGFVTRFERGGRKDAILRSTEGDEIAIEWEWGDIRRWINASSNELQKLKDHKVWSGVKGRERLLRYAVLVTYTHSRIHTPDREKLYNQVIEKWEEIDTDRRLFPAKWPLLLILIEVEKSRLPMHREFKNIQMSVFYEGKHTELRSAPAFPWEVAGTIWSYQLK